MWLSTELQLLNIERGIMYHDDEGGNFAMSARAYEADRLRMQEALAGAIAGIDGVDALLDEAGYSEDSSARHQLAIVRSLLTPNAAISGPREKD